ncbi:hypothetical protein PRIPAC_93660 [Pristionchus pacificus]|uniref:Uncharacterized protein n=1 Tax=Pristionchus pacificus TaxID=54126 RepID=A0A2A6BB08_PRIPA|nr:hypothetical protein PRIPAC_93660 [Pristionchus pacificus]|eukprot:PDM63046.1 hypothetical protein PRIPAC_50261 [Pristionchus pacificus]
MWSQSSGISPQSAAASVPSSGQHQSNAELAVYYTDLAIKQQTTVCELDRQQSIATAAAVFLSDMAEKHRAAAARDAEEQQARRVVAYAHLQSLQLITTICSYQISTIQSLMQAPPPHMNAFEARNELYRQHLERQGMDPASAALAAGVPERDPTQWNSPYAQKLQMIVHGSNNTTSIQLNAQPSMMAQNQAWMAHPFGFAPNQSSQGTNNQGTSSFSSSESSPARSATSGDLPEDPNDDDDQ